jgi:hypothetical protein
MTSLIEREHYNGLLIQKNSVARQIIAGISALPQQ